MTAGFLAVVQIPGAVLTESVVSDIAHRIKWHRLCKKLRRAMADQHNFNEGTRFNYNEQNGWIEYDGSIRSGSFERGHIVKFRVGEHLLVKDDPQSAEH
jgi:hypothetical protein